MRIVTHLALAITAGAILVAAGCGGSDKHEQLPKAVGGLKIASDAITNGGRIPARFTCDGAGVSPPIAWMNVPGGTREVVLVVRDPDAPSGSFQHWARWGLAPRSGGMLPEGAPPDPRHEGRNDFGKSGYGPPCPPAGDKPHGYVFTAYALARPLRATGGAGADAVSRAIAEAKPLATGELRATYGR